MLLFVGTFLRALDKAAMQVDGKAYDRLVEAHQTVDRKFHETMAMLTEEFDYEPIPIRDLVAVQVRARLTCLDYVLE